MKKVLFVLVAMMFALVACGNGTPAAAEKEQNATRDQMNQYLDSQPIPRFEWSLERHMMIELYKARNEATATWSYVRNMYTGRVMFECPSIGFPIPGGTQLTNPEQVQIHEGNNNGGNVVLPQPEPNGLYTPETSAGTFVMCVNDDGTVSPVYVEDYVETYPYPMEYKDGMLVRAEGVKPSISIETKQH